MTFSERRNNTLNKALAIIASKDGICIDNTYLHCKDKILIKCKNGHQWRNDPYEIIEGNWCRKCYHKERAKKECQKTYQKLLTYLREINSEVLEKSYDYRNQKLHYKCNNCKQIWTMEPTRLLEGNLSCTNCAKIARAERTNNRKKIRELEKQRIAKENEIKRQQNKNEQIIKKQQELALKEQERKIKLYQQKEESKLHYFNRSKEILNANNCVVLPQSNTELIVWRCPANHTNSKNPRTFVKNRNSWCQKCNRSLAIENAHKTRMDNNLKYAKEIAKYNDGKCLTEKCEKSADGFDFLCNRGHKFNLTYQQLHSGHQWCPECSYAIMSRGEAVCRTIIEQLLGESFPLTKNIPWLKSPKTNRQLSLDMYNEELNLAFEYHGKGVHFGFRKTGRYSNVKKYNRTIEIDSEKKQLCEENSLKLICIRGFTESLSEKAIIEQIKNILRNEKIPFDENCKIVIDNKKIAGENLTKRVQEICSKRNGKLIDDVVISQLSKIQVQCNLHQTSWQTTASKLIHRNQWGRPDCLKKRQKEKNQKTKEDIQIRADKIDRPFHITLLNYDRTGVQGMGTWYCEKHGKFKRRIDSVIYKKHNRYHGCPLCEKEQK